MSVSSSGRRKKLNDFNYITISPGPHLNAFRAVFEAFEPNQGLILFKISKAAYDKFMSTKPSTSEVKMYLSEIGRRGGLKSRRKLSSVEAKNMVLVREARRAFKKFYSQCFWSHDPKYKVEIKDIEWVAEQLKKTGGRKAFEVGMRLCP